MVRAISIIGHHDSGKTRLITKLVPLLAERGYRIGSVKHAPHLEELDAREADSAMHRASGVERVLLVGESSSALFWENDAEESIAASVHRLFAGLDIVLVEGFKSGPFPKIEVYRRSRDIPREPLAGEIDVCAVITDDVVALPDDVDAISPGQLLDVADLIESLAA
jgi:molybdopterin-guanine dinucleotide biosynthesis protein MobB